MNLSVERVVALLTPAFAALSAAGTGWLSRHFPGLPHLNPTDTTALMVAGATAGAGAALKWLHGRAQFTRSAAALEALIKSEVAKATANQQAAPALDDIEDLLTGHTSQIVQAIATAVHAPPSVAQVVEAILADAQKGKQPTEAAAPAEQPPPALEPQPITPTPAQPQS